MTTNIERVVIWFSAGVTSAVAAKIAVNKYGDPIWIVWAVARMTPPPF